MMSDPRDNNNNATSNDANERPAADGDQANTNTNPFISFRRYADDQISSLVNSVIGLPATVSKEHARWHAARQNNDSDSDAQVSGSGRQEVWVKRWSSDDGQDDKEKKSNEDDVSSWVKLWKPDGQEVKPEVIEDKNGGKTWHWSASWSWPPKEYADDANSVEGTNNRDELDRNFEEARKNAERELQEMSELFKSWFGAEDDHSNKGDPQQTDRGQSLLDWIGLGDASNASSDIRRDIEDRIKRLEDEFFNVRDSFSGFTRGAGPWGHLRVSDEAREGSQILKTLDSLHHSGARHGNPFGGFPMTHGWGHPLSYFLDYSNPRTRWLLQHPYSPAVLEAEAIKNDVAGAPRYADAFDDLMRAERGCLIGRDGAPDWSRSMWPRSYRLLSDVYSRNPRTQEFFRNVEEGGEWYVPEKQQQHSSTAAPKQIENGTSSPHDRVHDHRKEQAARDDHMYERFLGTHTADPQTELDMYERFLGDSSSHHQGGSGGSSSSGQAPAAPLSSKNNNIDAASSPILSTITTTERNIAPDGTVTTKVTLKKRFADGREESSETVNTTRGDPSGNGASFEGSDGSNKKKGGWFWSS